MASDEHRAAPHGGLWLAVLATFVGLVAGAYWLGNRPPTTPDADPVVTTTTLALEVTVWDASYTTCEVFGLEEIARQRNVPENPIAVAEVVGTGWRPPLDEVATEACFMALTGQPNNNPHR